jgi:uncharacterized protein YceH (UPF0502 family)
MALTDPEIRVLASLIEKEAAVPESYPLSLNALRLACNQSTNRKPVVAYDDRTVETALLSLKSVGLVRYVHPSHGGRTTRYRHIAGERWHLSPGELLVLSALALRGPQSVNEVRARIERLLPADESATVDEMLDTLAARGPEPFAIRLGRRPGEREDRWAALLGGEVAGDHDEHDVGFERPAAEVERRDARDDPALDATVAPEFEVRSAPEPGSDNLTERVAALTSALADVTARLDRLERELGL